MALPSINNYFGDLPLILNGPDINYGKKGEFDIVSYSILTSADPATSQAELGSIGFAPGAILRDPAFYAVACQEFRSVRESSRLRQVEVMCSGSISQTGLNGKGNVKRIYDPTPITTTGRSVPVGSLGQFPRLVPVVATTYAPVISETYITTTRPDISAIDKLIKIDSPPAVPYPTPVNNVAILYNPADDATWPYIGFVRKEVGWFLINRQPEVIVQEPGFGLWQVTDTLQYMTRKYYQIGKLPTDID